MELPSISIVTPTYNQGCYIEETICSVLDQRYPKLEYIIIDGGSTDNTISIIKKYAKYLKTWVSEQDKGQANAINKGLKYCTGDIFNWLNSDDYLEGKSLFKIAEAFNGGADLVAGGVRIFEDVKSVEFIRNLNLSSRGLMYWEKDVEFVQPGVWLKRKLIERVGGIDETYHYCFDWDLYIRYLSLFPNVKYLENLLVHFRYHPKSKTVTSQRLFHDEQDLIIEKLSQSTDINLERLAKKRISGRKWRAFLNTTISDNSKNKASKINMIIRNVDQTNLFDWRATAGALRRIISE